LILPGFNAQASHSADVSFDLHVIQDESDVVEFLGENLTGTGSIHDQEIFTSSSNTIDGDGPPLEGSMVDLLINPTACTYTFSLLTIIDAAHSLDGGATSPTDLGILWKSTESSMKNAADALEGSAAFTAQDVACVPKTACDTYYPGGFGLDFDLTPGNHAGSAGVTWSFTPVLPDASSASRAAPPASDAPPKE
jgi:hypothetical protein